MVYNIKMGIAAGAGIAGTAYSTFSSKMGSSQSNGSSNENGKSYGYGSNNGCSRSWSSGQSGTNKWNGSSNKNDDTFKQMHMWKYWSFNYFLFIYIENTCNSWKSIMFMSKIHYNEKSDI